MWLNGETRNSIQNFDGETFIKCHLGKPLGYGQMTLKWILGGQIMRSVAGESSSGSCPMMGFDIRTVEPSGSVKQCHSLKYPVLCFFCQLHYMIF